MQDHHSTRRPSSGRVRLGNRTLPLDRRAISALLLLAGDFDLRPTISELAVTLEAEPEDLEPVLGALAVAGVVAELGGRIVLLPPRPLRATQMRILAVVEECLDRGSTPSTTTVGALAGLSRTSTVAILDELERLGFLGVQPETGRARVFRTPEPDDPEWTRIRNLVRARLDDEHGDRCGHASTAESRVSRARTFACLLAFTAEHLRPPSTRELAAEVGRRLRGVKTAQGIHNHLVALERDGYLSRSSGDEPYRVAFVDELAGQADDSASGAVLSEAERCIIAAVASDVSAKRPATPVTSIASRLRFTPTLTRAIAARLARQGLVLYRPDDDALMLPHETGARGVGVVAAEPPIGSPAGIGS